PLADFRAALEIRALIKTLAPAIVHAHSSKAGILAAAALSSNRTPKLVYTAHGWVFLEPLPLLTKTLYKNLERWAGWRRDATIVLSQKEKAVALAHKLSAPDIIFVIPNGVAPRQHNRVSARELLRVAGVPKTATVIGSTANFYPSKNIPALVSAFASLAKEDENLRLILVGDGPERAQVESTARTAPGRVHLLGYRTDARELMDGFDFFALPSLKEGLPFALLEAMEAGLPCLATNVGGISEIIEDEKNGWLAEPKNLGAGLAHALEQKNRWPGVGTAAAKTIHEHFTLERMRAETLALFDQLTSKH
ncbi:glycosyltransferase family 1 protein, partial [Patescibacteria group bacterium]